MKLKRFISYIVILVLTSAAVTGCGTTDSPYVSPICGSWVLSTVNGAPIAALDQNAFTFYNDGTGVYGMYTSPVNWSEYAIDWELNFDDPMTNYLIVYTWGGDTWVYQFYLTGSTLELYDTFNGNRLLYRRYS